MNMELVLQILSDIRKSLRSILVFGIITIVSWVFTVWTLGDFISVVSESRYISAFRKDDIQYVMIDTFDSKYSVDPFIMDKEYSFDSNAFLEEKLGPDGNGGVLLDLGSTEYGSYDYVFILGIYNDYLVPAEVPESGVVFIGTKDLYEERNGKIRINADKYDMLPPSSVPDLYYPQGIYMSGGSMTNTLFVCSRDYKAVKKFFPWLGAYDFDGVTFLDRMIFRNLSDEENVWLRRSVTEQAGRYAQVISCEEYYSRNELSNVRQTLTCLVFYLLTFLALPLSMAVNNYTCLLNNRQSYLTHRMFGATLSCTFLRMLVLSLNYYILPVAFSCIFFAGSVYQDLIPWTIPVAIAGAAAATVAAYSTLRSELIDGKGGVD